MDHKIHIGDIVAVRFWEDMAAEYGLDGAGDIFLGDCDFVDSMRFLCGQVGVVADLEEFDCGLAVTLDGVDTQGYVITPEMLRIVERPDGKQGEQLPEIDVDQFMGFLFLIDS